MSPHCSICGLDCDTFAGTLITAYAGPMSKEKRHPTSDDERWLIKYDKAYEILRYCKECYEAFGLAQDVFRLKHLKENKEDGQEDE